MFEDDDSPFHYNEPDPEEQLLGQIMGFKCAHSLLQQLGSLRGIASADIATLLAAGVTKAQADRVTSLFEIGRRAVARPVATRILGPSEAASVLVPRMLHVQTEQVHALYLDSRSRLIRAELLSCGGQDRTIFDVREILGGALRMRASALVLGHNHPSGDIAPSTDDIIATRRLFDASTVLGIRLVDHLIIAGEEWGSLALKGHLPSADAVSPVIAVADDSVYSMFQRRSL